MNFSQDYEQLIEQSGTMVSEMENIDSDTMENIRDNETFNS